MTCPHRVRSAWTVTAARCAAASKPGQDGSPRMAALRSPTAALLTAAGLWGMAVTGTKYALCGFDPVTLLSIELMAGAGVLWAALLIRGYRPPESWWLPALLGLLEPALAYLGDTFGLSLTSAVHGAVINGLESGLVVVLAGMLLRETITRPAIVAVVAALAQAWRCWPAQARAQPRTARRGPAAGRRRPQRESVHHCRQAFRRRLRRPVADSLAVHRGNAAVRAGDGHPLERRGRDRASRASFLAGRRPRRHRRLRRQFPAVQYGDR